MFQLDDIKKIFFKNIKNLIFYFISNFTKKV